MKNLYGVEPIQPAYGRDYKSLKAFKNDFYSGKDFLTASGQYCNIDDLKRENINRIRIRYNNQRDTNFIDINEKFKTVKDTKNPGEPKKEVKKELKPIQEFITIDKTGKDFYEFKFVLTALEKPKRKISYREVLKVDNIPLLSTSEKELFCICTDGKRLHIIKQDFLSEGYYKVMTNNSKEIRLEKIEFSNYPDITSILRKNNPRDAKTIEVNTAFFPSSICTIIHNMEKNVGINPDYIKDLHIDYYSIYINKENSFSPITAVNHSGSRMAYIMPFVIR